LLPGCFSITLNNSEIGLSTIQKAAIGLQGEFDKFFFIIEANNKEDMLDELNFYNVNEASLFPELEHQMRYIRNDHYKFADPTSVSVFSKAIDTTEENTTAFKVSEDANLEFSDEQIIRLANGIIEPALVRGNLVDQIVSIIKNNLVVDWYKKPSVISKIKVEITRFLASQSKFDSVTSAQIANNFIKQFGDKLGIELEQ